MIFFCQQVEVEIPSQDQQGQTARVPRLMLKTDGTPAGTSFVDDQGVVYPVVVSEVGVVYGKDPDLKWKTLRRAGLMLELEPDAQFAVRSTPQSETH